MSGSPAKVMCTNSECIVGPHGVTAPGAASRDLHTIEATRQLEREAAQHLPQSTLMELAGQAVARLALAIAPHARIFWIACGPGNNGGDGYVAARYLQQWGKQVIATPLEDTPPTPPDAMAAQRAAQQAGVAFEREPPTQFDVCIDALFGIGTLRTTDTRAAQWIGTINQSHRPVLAVDIPSGLNADHGTHTGTCVRATATLSLLTLKPGLFTAQGRDACGEIWFNPLTLDKRGTPAACLNSPSALPHRRHDSHKGTFGDVAVVGGAPGMAGAALLAARAALHGGAGRVYALLLQDGAMPLDPMQPELMLRPASAITYETTTVVAGCGGGDRMEAVLPEILQKARRLVLDADALNAIATSNDLQSCVKSRAPGTTVLTPHPREAARLLGMETQAVQSNRLACAQALAQHFQCAVVLKGSGSVIAAPQQLPRINPTGNARLATAGTGDVLAGMAGANMSIGCNAFDAACHAAFRHGQIADRWQHPHPLTAQALSAAV